MVDAATRFAPVTLQEVEKKYIKRVLNHTKMNKTKASKILGISRVNLISKIKR